MINNCSIFKNHGSLLKPGFVKFLDDNDIENNIRPYLGYCVDLDHVHYLPKKYQIRLIIDGQEKTDEYIPAWIEKNKAYNRNETENTVIQIYNTDITKLMTKKDTDIKIYVDTYDNNQSFNSSLYAEINTLNGDQGWPPVTGRPYIFSIKGYESGRDASTGLIIDNFIVFGNTIIDVSTFGNSVSLGGRT